MTRGNRWLLGVFIACALLCAGAAGMYVFNPHGTASTDPRGRILGYETYRMVASSMSPTLQPGEFVLVLTGEYRNRVPAPGEVIVFFPPMDPGTPWIQRVVAGPGDRIAIRAGVLYRNDARIDEWYLDPAASKSNISREMIEFEVPPGALFVLGDNRDHSNDSRYWGSVDVTAVIGRAAMIWYSPHPDRTGEIQ